MSDNVTIDTLAKQLQSIINVQLNASQTDNDFIIDGIKGFYQHLLHIKQDALDRLAEVSANGLPNIALLVEGEVVMVNEIIDRFNDYYELRQLVDGTESESEEADDW